ncbi:MAG TPA: hypothetical protein VH280_14310 [Verrucomicrobiae bacterium]|jgi:hypothetical protein|nr:hypothetical protein [Verrucomicrobiae bacterium]
MTIFKVFACALAAIGLALADCPPSAQAADPVNAEKFQSIPLASGGKKSEHKILVRNGVPFISGALPFSHGSARVNIGGTAKHIYLLGMVEDATISCWADPTNHSLRFFVGDHLGQIRLNYTDGSTEVFPLILGESVWFGQPFYRYQQPFPTDAQLRKAFADALNLYPPTPVKDGNYVAVITPKRVAIRSITIENSTNKFGKLVLNGMTLETDASEDIPKASILIPDAIPSGFKHFIASKPLRAIGVDENRSHKRLGALAFALYNSDKNFLTSHVTPKTPRNYSGPEVAFAGSIYAKVLANAFSFNVQDISDKVDADGMYHTSTKGAVSWNGTGFGTFETNAGIYYATSWSRDMGRSLQELTELGYTNDALRCADYCLRMANQWTNPALAYHGHILLPHWSRIANRPQNAPPFENDGHALVSMFLYKLWQRLPDRNDWLRARWPDIKNAGDWVVWQLDHPEISGATNGVLHTTGECAGGNGYSVYGDYSCMNALRALAVMAESIGQTNSAAHWRRCADKMQGAIAIQYIISDPKYGLVWTLQHAGWPTHPTVLGPLILRADYDGFAPYNDTTSWHSVNNAAFQRLIDTYKPDGFYGQAMGYGQGFVTESALLLDRIREATVMLDWIAKQIYNPRIGCFISPEGVQIDPSGHYWFPAGDLGNGVQEAEIIKTLRLVIGVDDTHPDRLQFCPRMPFNWNEIAVKKYPVLFMNSGKMENTFLHFQLNRSRNGMDLEIGAEKPLGRISMRLGPFADSPNLTKIRVNGQIPHNEIAERSGDSWWVKFPIEVLNH